MYRTLVLSPVAAYGQQQEPQAPGPTALNNNENYGATQDFNQHQMVQNQMIQHQVASNYNRHDISISSDSQNFSPIARVLGPNGVIDLNQSGQASESCINESHNNDNSYNMDTYMKQIQNEVSLGPSNSYDEYNGVGGSALTYYIYSCSSVFYNTIVNCNCLCTTNRSSGTSSSATAPNPNNYSSNTQNQLYNNNRPPLPISYSWSLKSFVLFVLGFLLINHLCRGSVSYYNRCVKTMQHCHCPPIELRPKIDCSKMSPNINLNDIDHKTAEALSNNGIVGGAAALIKEAVSESDSESKGHSSKSEANESTSKSSSSSGDTLKPDLKSSDMKAAATNGVTSGTASAQDSLSHNSDSHDHLPVPQADATISDDDKPSYSFLQTHTHTLTKQSMSITQTQTQSLSLTTTHSQSAVPASTPPSESASTSAASSKPGMGDSMLNANAGDKLKLCWTKGWLSCRTCPPVCQTTTLEELKRDPRIQEAMDVNEQIRLEKAKKGG